MTVLATIIVLGVLIFIHELGHFGAAKLVGVEVQRFSIGLGPRVWGFRGGETEYVVSAIPLGGYVKMGGMEDEVMERLEGGGSDEPRTPGPRDFDGKPLWARALVISAGVAMNMVFAFLLYAVVAGLWGVREYADTRVGEVYEDRLPEQAVALSEVPVGSRITRLGDRAVDSWGDVVRGLAEADPGLLTVEFTNPKGRVQFSVPSSEEDRQRLARAVLPWVDAAVGAVEPGSPAEEGGIEEGDRILAVNGEPVVNWYAFLRAIESRPGARVEVKLLRDGRQITRMAELDRVEATDPATGDPTVRGRIGIYQPMEEVTYQDVGAVEAVVIGYRETVAITGLILGFLRDLVTGGVSPRSVGSIVTIGEASGQAASRGMDFFLSFMALFSVNLAILNLLPIPVLDGGHLLFLAIEGVRGRALSVEQRMRWSQVGFVLLLGIMVWALSNDFLRLLGM